MTAQVRLALVRHLPLDWADLGPAALTGHFRSAHFYMLTLTNTTEFNVFVLFHKLYTTRAAKTKNLNLSHSDSPLVSHPQKTSSSTGGQARLLKGGRILILVKKMKGRVSPPALTLFPKNAA